jgi:hypothetical protein
LTFQAGWELSPILNIIARVGYYSYLTAENGLLSNAHGENATFVTAGRIPLDFPSNESFTGSALTAEKRGLESVKHQTFVDTISSA